MELLEGLPLLTELPRGDFLCDALEWLDETDHERCSRFFRCLFFAKAKMIEWVLCLFDQLDLFQRLRLGISEFWASEDYFFHHSEQLHLVSTVCPNIRKMLFMFRWALFIFCQRRTDETVCFPTLFLFITINFWTNNAFSCFDEERSKKHFLLSATQKLPFETSWPSLASRWG